MGAAASSPEAETAASGEASEARGRKPRRRRQQQDRPQRVQFAEVSPGRREGVSSVEMLIDHEAAHQARGYGGNAAFIAGAKADAAALSGTQRASPIEAQRRLAHSRQLLRSLEVELLAAHDGGESFGVSGSGSGSGSGGGPSYNRPTETPPTVGAMLPTARRLISQQRRTRGEQYGDAYLRGNPRVPPPKPGPLPRNSLLYDQLDGTGAEPQPPQHQTSSQEGAAARAALSGALPSSLPELGPRGGDARGSRPGGGGVGRGLRGSVSMGSFPTQDREAGTAPPASMLPGAAPSGAIGRYRDVSKLYGAPVGVAPPRDRGPSESPPAPAPSKGKRMAWSDGAEGGGSPGSGGGGGGGGGGGSSSGGRGGIGGSPSRGFGFSPSRDGGGSRGSLGSSLSTPSLAAPSLACTTASSSSPPLQREPLRFSGARSCYTYHPLTQSSLSPPVSPYDLTVRAHRRTHACTHTHARTHARARAHARPFIQTVATPSLQHAHMQPASLIRGQAAFCARLHMTVHPSQLIYHLRAARCELADL
jgi:hypothetical protein